MNNEGVESKQLLGPVSRRSFFSISAVVGSLSVLGMATTKDHAIVAYADEGGNVHYNSIFFDRESIPIIAVDVSQKSAPVPDMEVKVTSYDRSNETTEVSSTVYTDDTGVATVNIRELSNEYALIRNHYLAGVTIKAKKEGYQSVEYDYYMAFSGGSNSNIQIPTKKIKKNVPYASCCSLSGYDSAFTWQQVTVASNNDYEYDFRINLLNFPEKSFGKNADLTFKANRKEFEITNIDKACTQISPSVVRGIVDNEGSVSFSVKGKWFSGKGTFPQVGSSLIASVKVDGYGTVLVSPKIKCTSGKLFGENSCGINQTIRPGSPEGLSSTEYAENEDNFEPCVGKEGPVSLWSSDLAQFNLSIPALGIEMWNDGDGEFGISAKIHEIPLKKAEWKGRNKEEVDPDDMKKKFFPDKKSMEDWRKDFDEAVENYNDFIERGDKIFGSAPTCSDFEASLSITGAIIGSMDEGGDDDGAKSNELTVDATFAIQPELEIKFEASKNFFVWVIPVLVGFDIGADLQADFRGGMHIQENYDRSITHADYSKEFTCSASAELEIETGVTVGIGIKEVMGIYIRGYINIDMNLAFGTHVSKNPEFDIEWAAGVQAILEFLIFTKEFTIVETDANPLYSNHDDNTIMFADPSIKGNPFKGLKPTQPASTLKESLNSESDFNIITEDMLRGVLESTVALTENGWANSVSYTSNFSGVKAKYNTKNLGSDFGFVDPYNTNTVTGLLYNPVKGFKATYDYKVLENIFFSPHMTTFMYQGELYVLRISSVEIQAPSSFSVYSNGPTSFIVADEDAALPKVKRDKNNNVMLDSKENVVYDIPAGMNKDHVAVFSDDCFEDMKGTSNLSKQERVNAFFNNREVKGAKEKAFLSNHRMSNDTSVVRTRLTCSKYDLATGQWTTPRVIDFAVPSTGNVTDERYNCFDTDMDVAVDNTQVRLVLTGTTRVDLASTPKIEQVFQTQHVYSLTYNVKTGEVKNVVVHAGNIHYTPRMPAFDWFSCYKLPSSSTNTSDSGLYLYDQNYGNTMLNQDLVWGDSRLDDNLSAGVYENHIVGDSGGVNTYSTFTAWYSPSKPEKVTDTNYGGLAAFWTTYYYEDVTGHYEIKHHFNFMERCVDSITYLGQADDTSVAGYDKCIRYLITRAADADNQRRFDIFTFMFNSKTGDFYTDFVRSHDLFGSSRIVKIYPGQDANHLYAARIMDEPNKKVRNTKYDNEEGRKFYGTKGPFASGLSCRNEENATGSLYQLIEGRWSEQHQTFFHMFPIASLDYEPDSVEYLTMDDYIKYFMVTHVTDFAAIKGDMHIVGVPYIDGIQIEDFWCGQDKVEPEKESYVDLLISNTGNMPISGFTVTVQINDDEHAPYYIKNNEILTDLSTYLVREELANYNAVLDPETGKPVVDPETGKTKRDIIDNPLDDEGVLWPGTTRSFRFDFTLPKDYEGEIVFKANVKDPITDKDSLFYYEKPSANNRDILTCADPREFTTTVKSETTISNFNISVTDADYQIVDENGKIIDETDPKIVKEFENESPLEHATGSSATGDSAPLNLGLGALAAGAVAAGAIAYEKRRAENENNKK